MIEQICIGLTAVIAIWLSQDRRQTFRKWASIFGLLSQPFWFYATWKAQQWGIFAVCFLYTYSWMKGFYNYWLRKEEA